MAREYILCVLSDETPEDFRDQFEKRLGIILQPILDNEDGFDPDFFSHGYFDDLHRRFCVFYQIPHPFISDASVAFEDYNYLIEIGAWGFEHTQERIKVALDYALEIFNILKATERYKLMLVKGVQKKVAEYNPP